MAQHRFRSQFVDPRLVEEPLDREAAVVQRHDASDHKEPLLIPGDDQRDDEKGERDRNSVRGRKEHGCDAHDH